jgi:hypothetical protein
MIDFREIEQASAIAPGVSVEVITPERLSAYVGGWIYDDGVWWRILGVDTSDPDLILVHAQDVSYPIPVTGEVIVSE